MSDAFRMGYPPLFRGGGHYSISDLLFCDISEIFVYRRFYYIVNRLQSFTAHN